MTDVLRMKRGDVYVFQHGLEWSDGRPIDLTLAASVTMKMIADGGEEYVVDGPMFVFDATNGVVQRMWEATDVAVSGMFRVEFVVTFNDGSAITVPSATQLWLWIMEDL